VSIFAVCRTSATEKHRPLANAAVVNNRFMLTIPGNAIVTLDGALTTTLNLIREAESFAFNLQAYPNPFHQTMRIHFTLPQAAQLSVAIFDLTGREVRELIAAPLAAGNHAVSWERKNRDGDTLRSGLYLVRLRYRAASTNAWARPCNAWS